MQDERAKGKSILNKTPNIIYQTLSHYQASWMSTEVNIEKNFKTLSSI